MYPLLSIDYGKKHTGLAIATTPLAEPLKTIPTSEAFHFIQEVIQKHHIKALIVGLSEGHMADLTRNFGSHLHTATGLPIYYQDETLSSYETRKKAAQAHIKKSRRQQKIDHLVAATILQDFIDDHSPLNELPIRPK